MPGHSEEALAAAGKAATSREIAALAGVSRGTVDRALHGRGGVRPEVEARIRKLAGQLGYVPNRAGKALVSRKNPPVLGVVLNSLGNPFFDEVKRGIAAAVRELSDFGLNVKIMEQKGYSVSEQLAALNALADSGVRGIAVMPVNDRRIAAEINALSDKGVVFVTLNTDIEDTARLAYIGCDYEKSGATAAGLANLITGGSANLLIVTGSIKNRGHNKRIYGFSRALKNGMRGIQIVDIAENEDDDALSYQVTADALKRHPEIDLVYLVSAGAGGTARAVSEAGREIPVLCFDDTEEIRRLLREDRITATICQEPYRQGRQSILTLFDAVVNGRKPETELLYTDCEITIKQHL